MNLLLAEVLADQFVIAGDWTEPAEFEVDSTDGAPLASIAGRHLFYNDSGVDDPGHGTAVEILKEVIITTTGSHPATGVTTTKLYYNSSSATGLTLRVVWAGIHTGVLDLNTTAFDTWLGSDLTKETTFEIRAWSGGDWDQTVFQTTATVKQEGFV